MITTRPINLSSNFSDLIIGRTLAKLDFFGGAIEGGILSSS